MSEHDDRELAELVKAATQHDTPPAPSFERTWSRAREAEPNRSRVGMWIVAVAAVLIASVGGYLLLDSSPPEIEGGVHAEVDPMPDIPERTDEEPSADAEVLALGQGWEAPTDFLLSDELALSAPFQDDDEYDSLGLLSQEFEPTLKEL